MKRKERRKKETKKKKERKEERKRKEGRKRKKEERKKKKERKKRKKRKKEERKSERFLGNGLDPFPRAHISSQRCCVQSARAGRVTVREVLVCCTFSQVIR